MATDSTGKPIHVGDKVRFRGEFYIIETIEENGKGVCGTAQIFFTQEQHIPEIASEVSVDLVS